MRTIHVVAAIIKTVDEAGKPMIFATQRGYGDYKGWWEFPGGKIEDGETRKEALKREMREELDIEVEVGELIANVEYDYPKFHLIMDCFLCEIKDGDLKLRVHEDARWLYFHELDSVKWLEADIELVEKLPHIL